MSDQRPEVLNKKRDGVPDGAVYVGRPTKWGNPFSHLGNSAVKFRVASRDEAICRYREWVLKQPTLMAQLHELRGKDLVCWCAPDSCHAEVLLELANSSRSTE